MERTYYILNDLIKSYHVFVKYDPAKAAEILNKINDYRLQIAVLAEKRQIFYEQLNVAANATGYKNDIFFSHDDLDATVIRMIGFLGLNTLVSLTHEGTREQLFTGQSMPWQHLMSNVQIAAAVGQKVPFDFPQDIYLERSQTLDIGVVNQTVAGNIFVHGCNMRGDSPVDRSDLLNEIMAVNSDGSPSLPEFQIVPIQFKFTAAALDNKAVAVDGSDGIYSVKSDKSVILTEVSTTSINSRVSLFDRGRDQEICDTVESLGVAGRHTDNVAVYYKLPYPHLLRKQDRLQLKGLNGSIITATNDVADTTQVMSFRGFTI